MNEWDEREKEKVTYFFYQTDNNKTKEKSQLGRKLFVYVLFSD